MRTVPPEPTSTPYAPAAPSATQLRRIIRPALARKCPAPPPPVMFTVTPSHSRRPALPIATPEPPAMALVTRPFFQAQVTAVHKQAERSAANDQIASTAIDRDAPAGPGVAVEGCVAGAADIVAEVDVLEVRLRLDDETCVRTLGGPHVRALRLARASDDLQPVDGARCRQTSHSLSCRLRHPAFYPMADGQRAAAAHSRVLRQPLKFALRVPMTTPVEVDGPSGRPAILDAVGKPIEVVEAGPVCRDVRDHAAPEDSALGGLHVLAVRRTLAAGHVSLNVLDEARDHARDVAARRWLPRTRQMTRRQGSCCS